MSDADLRRDLVTANRVAHHEGLFEAFGHISARVPGSQDWFYIARRMSPALVTADDLLCMDVRGNVVEGSGRPNMEFWIHASIYAARPDVGVVVHAHPPYCVALANAGQTVRALYEGSFTGGTSYFGLTASGFLFPVLT